MQTKKKILRNYADGVKAIIYTDISHKWTVSMPKTRSINLVSIYKRSFKNWKRVYKKNLKFIKSINKGNNSIIHSEKLNAFSLELDTYLLSSVSF